MFECSVSVSLMHSGHLLIRTTCSLCQNIDRLFLSTDHISCSSSPFETELLCDVFENRMRKMSALVDDVVSSTYDGEKMMKKYARELKRNCIEMIELIRRERGLLNSSEVENFEKVVELSQKMLSQVFND